MISLNVYLTNNLEKQWPIRILFLLVICVGTTYTYGQETIDTSIVAEDFVYEKKNSFKSVFYGQPGKAALYSIIAPGGGQLYNKRWWKAPLVWAGEGFLVYNLIQSIDNFQSWETCRLGFLDPDITPVCDLIRNRQGIEVEITSASDAFDQQQTAKAAKERAWLFLIAGHLIQTLEAFVDRHLINFNTTDHLSFNSNPSKQIDINRFGSAPLTVFSVSINLNHFTE